MASDKYAKAQAGSSLSSLAAIFAFMATTELAPLYGLSNKLLASLAGLVLAAAIIYIAPPRPKLWIVLLVTGLVALVFVGLHLLHVG